jgi:hypothetical protein
MKKLLLPLLALSLGLFSCSGPRGPQGPPGYDGLDADVFAVEYEVLPSAWAASGTAGDPDFGYVALAAFPELTNNVLMNGNVNGFYILDDGGQVPMPAIFYNNGFSTNYDYILYNGEIEFWVRESDNQTVAPNSARYYKMVVVQTNFKTLPDLKEMTLPEIEAYFHIEEYKKVTLK